MRTSLAVAGLVLSGCVARPCCEPPVRSPPPAVVAEAAPPAIPPRPAAPTDSKRPAQEGAHAPEQPAPPPVAAEPAAPKAPTPTPFDDSPALPKPEHGVLGTTDYQPLEREKPFFEGLPASHARGTVTSIDAKEGDSVSWLGIVRGIEVDGTRGRTRLLLESKYFDGLTDTHIFCVNLNGGGDFIATLDGAEHPVRPLALVRVYGKVTAVKDGLPRVRADFVRQWDQGRFTFMFMEGPQKGSEAWRKLIDSRVDDGNVYSSHPGEAYYRARLGARDDFAPGKVPVPAD